MKSFKVIFRKAGRQTVDAKRLHTLQYQKPEFRTAWAHLRDLSLIQTITTDTMDWAMELVSYAVNLKRLTLEFLGHDHSRSFIDRLSSADILPRLQELKISCTNITVETLSGFLLRFRNSLRILSFKHVMIDSDGHWESVFGQLGRKFPLLESICVHSLLREGRPRPIHIAFFPELTDSPVLPGSQDRWVDMGEKKFHRTSRLFCVSYRGPGMDLALEMLVSFLVHVIVV